MRQVFGTQRAQQPAVQWSDHIDVRVLAADTPEEHTVPADAGIVVLSATADFYAKADGGTIAVPAADVTNGVAPELNPLSRLLAGVTKISLVAPVDCVVTLAFYK